MPRSFASSRLALTLRRLRGRFGISAPRVAIRTQLPWYWRALGVVLLAGVSLALAGWIYDAGQRFAGFHQGNSEQEIASMRERLAQLEAELESARTVANSSESRLRIESTSLEQLSQQIRTLEEENTRLKADLATFESLAGGQAGDSGLAISRLQILSLGGGQYRYRLLLARSGDKKDKEFNGMIQLIATVQRGAETAMMQFPTAGDPAAGQYQVSFRFFQRLEGTFKVAAETPVQRVEVRLVQGGVVKASQSVVL
jgi:TolA-binding protein